MSKLNLINPQWQGGADIAALTILRDIGAKCDVIEQLVRFGLEL